MALGLALLQPLCGPVTHSCARAEASTPCRARSSIIKTSINPEWNERFLVPVADKVAHITIIINDNNAFSSPPIGHARVPVAEVRAHMWRT